MLRTVIAEHAALRRYIFPRPAHKVLRPRKTDCLVSSVALGRVLIPVVKARLHEEANSAVIYDFDACLHRRALRCNTDHPSGDLRDSSCRHQNCDSDNSHNPNCPLVIDTRGALEVPNLRTHHDKILVLAGYRSQRIFIVSTFDDFRVDLAYRAYLSTGDWRYQAMPQLCAFPIGIFQQLRRYNAISARVNDYLLAT